MNAVGFVKVSSKNSDPNCHKLSRTSQHHEGGGSCHYSAKKYTIGRKKYTIGRRGSGHTTTKDWVPPRQSKRNNPIRLRLTQVQVPQETAFRGAAGVVKVDAVHQGRPKRARAAYLCNCVGHDSASLSC